MTDTYKSPRRPIVPGPTSPPPGGTISARAIATREAQREAAVGGLTAGRALHSEMDRQASQRELARAQGVAGLGASPEIFTRNLGPVGNLAGAIANVMANVGTIKKGGFNAYHRYNYARMEDLLEALTPLMGQNGIAVFQNEIEIKQVEGNRVAVVYEFTVAHKSGEIWHEKQRHTGMSTARDSKGNWDDKAIAKCHTQARKYFLLALFQVPAGDFADSDDDKDNANRREEQRPVPGPQSAPAEQEPAPVEKTLEEKLNTERAPQKLGLGPGAGPDQWANAYLKMIARATSQEEVKQWDELNDSVLQHLSDNFSAVYDMVAAKVAERLAELRPPGAQPTTLLDGEVIDVTACLNWVAGELQTKQTYQQAETFWNQMVAPHEDKFELEDWNMLIKEWNRAEQRLAPEPPDQAA